jgi:hypothetical protein
MSVFNESGNPVTTETPATIESYLQELVGEGKKFQDGEALAKGKFESDRFVEDLKRQNEELRADLENGSKIDALMQLIKDGQKSPEASGDSQMPTPAPDVTSPGSMSEEQLRALIESHVSTRENETTRQRNIQAVDQEMTNKFGNSAHDTLRRRAAELDMSLEEVQDIAASKPKAFFKLMGLGDKATAESSVSVGNPLRTEGDNFNRSGTTRNWEFYQKLRRESKSKYYAPAMQQQLLKDRAELGDKFGMPT